MFSSQNRLSTERRPPLPSKQIAAGVAAVVMAGAAAHAGTVSYSITSGVRSASATFSTSAGSDLLTIVLTNTSTSDVVQPDQILTAVFFDWLPPPSYPSGFNPVSALLTGGSTVYYGPMNGGDVGGEWAYRENAATIPQPLGPGISAAGLGLFDAHATFNNSNLQGPASVGGLQYGITSAGDDLTNGNTPVTGGNALIKNSVTFTLQAVDPSFDLDAGSFLSRLRNVRFQYGTSLSEPQFLFVVPLPPAAWAGLSSLVGVALCGMMRRRRNQAV